MVQAPRNRLYPSVVTEDRLTTPRLNRATLERQGLLERHTGGAAAAIGRLAGLQAQHANQPYIALWSRLHDLAIADLQGALERRSIVRATVMRMTIHLVASVDFAAYDGAVAARRMAQWTSTAREAGVDLAELHGSLLAYCREPRTVAEMETHLDTIAPDSLNGGTGRRPSPRVPDRQHGWWPRPRAAVRLLGPAWNAAPCRCRGVARRARRADRPGRRARDRGPPLSRGVWTGFAHGHRQVVRAAPGRRAAGDHRAAR